MYTDNISMIDAVAKAIGHLLSAQSMQACVFTDTVQVFALVHRLISSRYSWNISREYSKCVEIEKGVYIFIKYSV